MTMFRTSSRRRLVARVYIPASRSGAFTLVEMLVVIGIVMLLSAILFPAFKGVQERGAQTTCATNMQQIYLAVRLYKDDEREYPSSLAALLPDTMQLQNTAGTADADKGMNIYGTGYYRKGIDDLKCPNDDTDTPPVTGAAQTNLRSSYGDVSNGIDKAAYYEQVITNDPSNADFYDDTKNPFRDWSRYSWNYWGLNDKGVGFRSADKVVAYLNTLSSIQIKQLLRSADKVAPEDATTTGLGWTIITSIDGDKFYYNPQGLVLDNNGYGTTSFMTELREENPLRYSMSNRFAPETTILTHCVYHRLQTGRNVIGPNPQAIYNTPADGEGARDVVLRLDGTAKSYDISKWNSPDYPRAGHGSNWQISDF